MDVKLEPDQSVAGGSSREWKLVQRVVSSRSFAKSQRLKSFLLFVCDRQIQGREDEISEHQIGIQVFGRPPGYNPGEDSIVRTHARLLRQRLDAYFEEEAVHESLRLSIPKGSYVPVFVPAEFGQPEVVSEVLSPTDVPIPSGPAALRENRRVLPFIVVGVLALLAGYALHALLSKSAPHEPHPLWSRVFQQNTDTLFVAADTGLVLYENMTSQTVPLASYVTRIYSDGKQFFRDLPSGSLYDLSMRRYTGFVDLNLMTRLMKLPDLVPGRYQLRYARDLQLEDLKNSNIILSGASEANPWVDLFQDKFNFRLQHNQGVLSFTVLNLKPKAGEPPAYVCSYALGSAQKGIAFGHIAFLPNLSGTGEVLVIEGTGSAGTEAAIDFVFNENQFRPAIERIRHSGRTLPHFEMLVSTAYIGDSRAPGSQLVAFRSLP